MQLKLPNVPEAFRVAGHPIGSYYGYKAIGIIRDSSMLKTYNKTTQFNYGSWRYHV